MEAKNENKIKILWDSEWDDTTYYAILLNILG